MADPLHQFEVQSLIQLPPLAGYNIDFTNASLFMMIAVVATVLLMQLGMRGRALVPGRWQSIVELSYGFVANTVKDNVGSQGRFGKNSFPASTNDYRWTT